MNRTVWCLGLVAAIACLCWAQEPPPSIEQLQTRLEELRQARDALLSPAWQAITEAKGRHKSGQWPRPLDTYLASVPFSMPPILSENLPTSPLYVEILQVRRIDAQILRYYPHSQTDFPYYEVKARILNTWGGYALDFHIPVENPYHLKTGQEIRLLWVARRPVEESFKKSEEETERQIQTQRTTQIWAVGKRYLLFGYRGLALDVPHEEREQLSLALNSLFDIKDYERWHQITGVALPSPDKFLFLVGESRFHVLASSVAQIEAYASLPSPSFCSRVPYWVLADPSEQLLQLLDEESVVLRLSKKERSQWLTRRLRDTNIPLWKRQRALLYLWDCEDPPDRFLQLLTTLDPPLRAFGLQKFQQEMCEAFPLKLRGEPAAPEARRHWVVRVFGTLAQFLEASQPVEVRREAAWSFAIWAAEPNRVTDWEKIGVEWAWWQEWANRLKRLSQEDTDEITRLLLDASWRQIASVEHVKQINEVTQQLRASERSRAQ